MLRLAVDTLSSLLAYGKDWRSCIKKVYGKASSPPTCNFFTYDVVCRASAATVMAMTFGYEYPSGLKNDHFATLAEDIAGGVTSLLSTTISIFSFLRHISPCRVRRRRNMQPKLGSHLKDSKTNHLNG